MFRVAHSVKTLITATFRLGQKKYVTDKSDVLVALPATGIGNVTVKFSYV